MEHWRSARNSHQLSGQKSHRTMDDQEENGDRGGLGWRTVASGFDHRIGHWRGLIRESQLDDGCCVSHQSWSGTALLCVCCIQSALENGKCTSDERTRSGTTAKRHDFEKHAKRDHQHAREKTWRLSWYSGDQLWQLMEMLNAQCCRNALVQLLRRIAIMSENQTRCSGDDGVQSEFFDGVTGGDDYLYESKLWDHDHILTHALDDEWARDDGNVRRVLVKLSDAHDWNAELNQQSCTRVAHDRKRNSWHGAQSDAVGPHPAVFDWNRDKASSLNVV